MLIVLRINFVTPCLIFLTGSSAIRLNDNLKLNRIIAKNGTEMGAYLAPSAFTRFARGEAEAIAEAFIREKVQLEIQLRHQN